MKSIRLITRADDAASSESANLAIAHALQAGVVKNVSVMAPGTRLAQTAQLLAGNKAVCFGMHGTLNAEWDRIKWKPVASLQEGNGLVDENGDFLPAPSCFTATKPPVEVILQEFSAQLDLLTKAGFKISYLDTHMLPETAIPGLDEALEAFIRQKGLLDHMYYYHFPPGMLERLATGGGLADALNTAPDGQYFYVAHPSLDTEEMRQTGNTGISGAAVAAQRGREARQLGDPGLLPTLQRMGIQPLRYDEATPMAKRLKAYEVTAMLGG